MAISSRTHRVGYLDGIRAIAICAVLVVHWVGSQYPAALGGYIGVDIFFILSGYIITTMLWKSRSEENIGLQYSRFMGRRFFRLYPALVGAVVGTIALYALFPGAPQTAMELLPSALVALIQGSSVYAAAGAAHSNPFAATWSLSIEWMFYMLWPLAVYLAKRKGVAAESLGKWTVASAIVLYVGALVQDSHWFYYGPLARIPEILIGGALALRLADCAEAERPLRFGKLALWLASVAILGIVAYVLFGPVQWSPVFRFFGLPMATFATVYLIWLGVRFPTCLPIRALGWAPLTFIGRVSYSLYLWHSIGVTLFTRENTDGMPLPVVAAVGVCLAIVTTGLSYKYLELPFMRSQSTLLKGLDPVSTNPRVPSFK